MVWWQTERTRMKFSTRARPRRQVALSREEKKKKGTSEEEKEREGFYNGVTKNDVTTRRSSFQGNMQCYHKSFINPHQNISLASPGTMYTNRLACF